MAGDPRGGRNAEDLRERFYAQMILVRRFEERVLELFSEGRLAGTTHACIGQEANACGVLDHLAARDIVVSNHRCHGHYLVRTGDATGLMAELMGKEGGVCGGRGGSQHLCHGNFYTNGVQGNLAPAAAGMAWAEKRKGSGGLVVLFLGDGTFGQGTVYETFNMASLWSVPLLIVVENNRYAQTTPLTLNFAGSFIERVTAFGISASEVESNDVEILHQRFAPLVKQVRDSQRPHVEVLHTYRLCSHSKGDDYRDPKEIASWSARDPLEILAARLPAKTAASIEAHARGIVEKAERAAEAMPTALLEVPGSAVALRGAA